MYTKESTKYLRGAREKPQYVARVSTHITALRMPPLSSQQITISTRLIAYFQPAFMQSVPLVYKIFNSRLDEIRCMGLTRLDEILNSIIAL